jgi:hypothetical protein
MSLSKQDVGARVSCYPRQGDTGGSRPKGNLDTFMFNMIMIMIMFKLMDEPMYDYV